MTETAKRQGRTDNLARFYTMPHADKVPPRREIFTLLRWYHEHIALPNQGLRGFFRRIWWRLTRQRHKLLSPWVQLEIRAQQLAALEEAERRAAENAESNGAPRIVKP